MEIYAFKTVACSFFVLQAIYSLGEEKKKVPFLNG